MIEFFKNILREDFMPHGHCYLWDPALVWVNALANGAMALSYLIIPITVLYIIKNRKEVKFTTLVVFFALTILGSCVNHGLDVLNIWVPYYRLDAVFRTITAISALGTAFMLIRIAPQLSVVLNTRTFKKVIEQLNSEIQLLKEQDNTEELVHQNLLVEQALKKSEDRFYAIANNIPNLAWIADSQQVISWFNHRWFEYTGLRKEQLDHEGLKSVIDPSELPFVISKWTEAIKKQDAFEMILSIKGGDGVFRPFLTRVVPLKDEHGKIINWVGSNTDISDRAKAEELLKTQNAELLEFRELAIDEMQNKTQILNGILEYAPVIVYKINKQGIITDAYGSGINSIADNCDLRGKNASDISLNISIDEINRLADSRKSYTTKGYCNGKTWYFDNYFFPDRVSNEGVIGIGMNVTVQKETAEQLSYEKERAENANFFKSRFLANMSHEIRTPLNAIIGFAGVLSKQDISQEKQKEYLNHINSSGSLLLKLIGDILDLSKIEEGKLSLQEDSFHVEESLSSAIMPYKHNAVEKGLSFALHFDQSIPQFLIGDAYRIKQVIINLIGNALKFTQEGGLNIVISAKPSNIKDHALIEIALSDTGIGVKDENKNSIFESFTQGDNTIARKFGGSGLGLAIVKQLVDKMGGNIWVEDNKEADKGSTFF
ncbi:MAG TPA: ATP-binding protein, partial [Cytophagaceae bacterium]